MRGEIERMNERREGFGEEYPRGDLMQGLMLVTFLAIWGLDSFVFKVTLYGGVIQPPVRLVMATLLFLGAVPLGLGSHRLVFDEPPEEPKVIEEGVFGVVRHPLYLSIMLIYLGLVTATGSLASLILLVGVFIVYDRLAEYEEEALISIFKDEYEGYRGRVPKWVPFLKN